MSARTLEGNLCSRQRLQRSESTNLALTCDIRKKTMYRALRPLLFALPPSFAHRLGSLALAPLEYVGPLRRAARAFCAPGDARLASHVLGLDFASPLGMAGGFDKDGRRPRALAALGFGFVEVGTVTAEPQEANPSPNVFRLPEDRALVNRLGFPNRGAACLAQRLEQTGDIGVPLGISIGKSRIVGLDPIEGAIDDYLASFRAVREVADFVVVNVSSPNTKNLRALQTPNVARALLGALVRENAVSRVPLLVKVAPDLDDAGLEGLLAVVEELGIDGIVATNTTTGRVGLRTSTARVEAIGAGGLSGPPLRERALAVVRRIRRRLGRSVAVVGVGGIENASHAMEFMRAGANLVQLYTAFVYEGPGVARAMGRHLADLVTEAGASNIAQLVGRDVS